MSKPRLLGASELGNAKVGDLCITTNGRHFLVKKMMLDGDGTKADRWVAVSREAFDPKTQDDRARFFDSLDDAMQAAYDILGLSDWAPVELYQEAK